MVLFVNHMLFKLASYDKHNFKKKVKHKKYTDNADIYLSRTKSNKLKIILQLIFHMAL